MAEFLEDGLGGQGEIELAAVEQVAVDVDALFAGMADGCVGGQGAVQFFVAA